MDVLLISVIFQFLVIFFDASSAYETVLEDSPRSRRPRFRPPGKNSIPDTSGAHTVRNLNSRLCLTGREQSPIDIVVRQCHPKNYPHVEFVDDILFTNDVTYENNCETVKITMLDQTLKPKVRGGALANDTDYIINEVHFHWGAKDNDGCEHTINGKYFEVEAHVVVYKSTDKDLETALENRNVAVLSFMFQYRDKKVNKELLDVVKGVTQVLQPYSTYKGHGSSLAFLKNYIDGGFYTYRGSLTTHHCTEGILWMVFKKHILLSHSQLLIFHDVIGEDENELKNWRRTVPLNGRQVYETSY